MQETAIEQTKSLLQLHKLTASVLTQDIRTYSPENTFTFINCSNVLHFFKKEEAEKIIQKLQETTVSDGIHILQVFTPNGELRQLRGDFYTPEALKSFYVGWNVVAEEKEFVQTMEKHEDGKPKKHEIFRVIFQKSFTAHT